MLRLPVWHPHLRLASATRECTVIGITITIAVAVAVTVATTKLAVSYCHCTLCMMGCVGKQLLYRRSRGVGSSVGDTEHLLRTALSIGFRCDCLCKNLFFVARINVLLTNAHR